MKPARKTTSAPAGYLPVGPELLRQKLRCRALPDSDLKGGLIVGKAGLKKHEASPEDDIGPRWLSTSRPGIIAAEVTLSRFAGFLTRKMDRPVVDKTGIPGEFDIDLRFAPLGANPEDDAELSVCQAIQMVGLKLEPRKSPVQVLVVDHISKPSPN